MGNYFSVFTHQCWDYLLPDSHTHAQTKTPSVCLCTHNPQNAVKAWTTVVPFITTTYFLSSIVCIAPFSMSSSCPLWFLTSLSSCVISRHLKSWVLYKCMQHSSIIHCFSLPDCCRFFFPPPFCGSWPISYVRAPDSEWNITVLFGTAPPNHFLQTSAHKKQFLLRCHKKWCFSRFLLSFQGDFWCCLSLYSNMCSKYIFPQWGYAFLSTNV